MTRVSRATVLFKVLLAIVLVWGLSPIGLLASVEKAYADSIASASGYGTGDAVVLTVDAQTDNNPWYSFFEMALTYASGETHYIQVSGAPAQGTLKAQLDWGSTVGSATLSGDGNPSYTATITLPASMFASGDFTLSVGGTTFSSADLGFAPAAEPAQPEEQPAADQGEGASDENAAGSQEGAGDEDGDDADGSPEAADPAEPAASAPASTLAPTASGSIVVDGDDSDWAAIAAQPSNDSEIAEWKVARDADGNVYFMFTGTAVSEWYGGYDWKYLSITQSGQQGGLQFATFAATTGGTIVTVNNANGNSAAPYVSEMVFPASYFTDENATFSFCGATVSLADVPVLDGSAVGGGEAVYSGIAIDGSFKDWDAVTKYAAWCPNGQHPDCIDQVAAVWDGDTVYLYIHEAPGGSAAGAGTHGNGQYVFITDLGRQLIIDLENDGSVNGVEGAVSSHVGAQWEIAIPASNLPEYLNSFSFGLYTASDGGDPFITDITNLNGQGSGGSFGGAIVVDGQYGDWAYYPHSIIEYATPGTQSGVADSEGALYSQDGMLYAHVVTTMAAHTGSESGGEFLAAVSVAFNGDRDFKEYPSDGNFYPKFFTVDADGSITVVNEGTHLPNGTYDFYIADIRTDFSSTNFNDLDESEYFGNMKVTIQDGKDEMEFQVDLVKLANYLGADANDFHIIEAQFGRLGQQWISTAGTSTAPFVGIGLGLACVAGVLGYRRYNAKHDQNGVGGLGGTTGTTGTTSASAAPSAGESAVPAA